VHWDAVVQGSPSSQGIPTSWTVWLHWPSLHASAVHSLWSSQSIAVWTQPLAGSQVSTVQGTWSLQKVLSGVWVQPARVQRSTVQVMLSLPPALLAAATRRAHCSSSGPSPTSNASI